MRSVQIIFASVFVVMLLATSALAGEVRVFMPVDEDLSQMALRNKAMADGFAMAVIEESRPMLPGELDEVRTELFRQYLHANAKPYILGYKIISSEFMPEGLLLVLDVRVNKRTLRDGLKRLGLMATVVAPLDASVAWPEDLNEEEMQQLQGFMALTGVQNVPDVMPMYVMERGPEGTFKVQLEAEDRQWRGINKDMSKVWFDLWANYFTRSEAAQARSGVQKLTVSGWFSPDAALEFDRVLKTWDSAIQEVELLELDMQPTGVGGVWEVRLLSGDRLNMMLQSYLPQRGLTYQLSEEPTP